MQHHIGVTVSFQPRTPVDFNSTQDKRFGGTFRFKPV
jgi:hypothetical protein